MRTGLAAPARQVFANIARSPLWALAPGTSPRSRSTSPDTGMSVSPVCTSWPPRPAVVCDKPADGVA
jgi:hypothetical protein